MVARFASLVATLVLVAPPIVQAEDPTLQAQSVISDQIRALMQDDAEKAYSYASPDIRMMYPDKNAFLTMVQKNYEAVYHAGNYAFGRSKLIGGGEMVFQEVMITGPDGKDWTAIYEMRLMDDGSYKVNGVRMMKNSTSTGI
ncbi:DUF4864 domain-containing protein [Rhizobium wenxiniae]|uniref:DUF4864 domain-containing protein n=1 Tax=Rhizobium wenxiniae TaxID=1737357 RepID=UPI001C6F5C9F|nr:DUF4864 domain-containing protein [Rhizobium wenxiniae]MBW9090186.1 DUF4864 domain-containing protein [Rhizobium wenxiniae]